MITNINFFLSYAPSFFPQTIFQSLTKQQKQLLIITSIAYTCFTAFFLMRHYGFFSKTTNHPLPTSESLKEKFKSLPIFPSSKTTLENQSQEVEKTQEPPVSFQKEYSPPKTEQDTLIVDTVKQAASLDQGSLPKLKSLLPSTLTLKPPFMPDLEHVSLDKRRPTAAKLEQSSLKIHVKKTKLNLTQTEKEELVKALNEFTGTLTLIPWKIKSGKTEVSFNCLFSNKFFALQVLCLLNKQLKLEQQAGFQIRPSSDHTGHVIYVPQHSEVAIKTALKTNLNQLTLKNIPFYILLDRTEYYLELLNKFNTFNKYYELCSKMETYKKLTIEHHQLIKKISGAFPKLSIDCTPSTINNTYLRVELIDNQWMLSKTKNHPISTTVNMQAIMSEIGWRDLYAILFNHNSFFEAINIKV